MTAVNHPLKLLWFHCREASCSAILSPNYKKECCVESGQFLIYFIPFSVDNFAACKIAIHSLTFQTRIGIKKFLDSNL